MTVSKYSTILCLPVLVLASACATTQPISYNSDSRGSAGVGYLAAGSAVEPTLSPQRTVTAPWLQNSGSLQLAPVTTAGRPEQVQPRNQQAFPKKTVGFAMGLGPRDAAPEGLYDFCARSPETCGTAQPRYLHTTAQPETRNGFMLASYRPNQAQRQRSVFQAPSQPKPISSISWTPETRSLVNRINRKINDAMIGTTDVVAFGRTEFWTMPLSGPDRPLGRARPLADCEDFALEKRRALLEAGIPEDAIYLAVAVSERTGLHAVLVVSTDQGDIVLDNLSDWLVEWSRTNYVWIKRQSTTSMMDWVVAGDKTAPREREFAPQPEFLRENPLIMASLEPSATPVLPLADPARPTSTLISLPTASTNAKLIGRSQQTKPLLGLRGFVNEQRDRDGAAEGSTASLNGFDKSISARSKFATGEVREISPFVLKRAEEKDGIQQFALVAGSKAKQSHFKPVREAGRKMMVSNRPVEWAIASPLRTVTIQGRGADKPSSVYAPLTISLSQELQKLPDQSQWFFGPDGSFVEIGPQKLPAFATREISFPLISYPAWVYEPETKAMASLN